VAGQVHRHVPDVVGQVIALGNPHLAGEHDAVNEDDGLSVRRSGDLDAAVIRRCGLATHVCTTTL